MFLSLFISSSGNCATSFWKKKKKYLYTNLLAYRSRIILEEFNNCNLFFFSFIYIIIQVLNFTLLIFEAY